MRILVYAHRQHLQAAQARVDALRAEGHAAQLRDTRGFDGDVETCDRVLTDDPRVVAAHQARGIEVLPFTTEQATAAEGGDPETEEGAGARTDAEEKPAPNKRRTRRGGR